MRSTILEIASGMGVLIAIFLFLNNYSASVAIISSLGTNTSRMVKTLQGRG